MSDAVRNLRHECSRALVLLILAALMFAASRGLQWLATILFSGLLPLLAVVTAVVLYFRSPVGEARRAGRGAGAVLFLLAFVTTTGFWVLSLVAIEYHTPVGDTGGLLFMVTLMPAGFVYWWPGLAVALGRTPFPGSRRYPLRSACLVRGLIGTAGGLAAGLPLYVIVLYRGWDNTVLIPF